MEVWADFVGKYCGASDERCRFGDPKEEAQREGAQRTLIFIDGYYPSMISIDGYPSMNINGYPVL